MSLFDYLLRIKQAVITKEKFGEIMHGNYTEEEKQAALEEVERSGGYEALEQD